MPRSLCSHCQVWMLLRLNLDMLSLGVKEGKKGPPLLQACLTCIAIFSMLMLYYFMWHTFLFKNICSEMNLLLVLHMFSLEIISYVSPSLIRSTPIIMLEKLRKFGQGMISLSWWTDGLILDIGHCNFLIKLLIFGEEEGCKLPIPDFEGCHIRGSTL